MEARENRERMLDVILAHKRAEVERARYERPLRDVEAAARAAVRPRSLIGALAGPGGPAHRIIAEIKRASPSRGAIRADLDPAEFARRYERGGASAVSVLTDGRFFGGSLADLDAVKAATGLPVLRKDFLVDPYQVFEARCHGADAVLVIARAVSRPDLQRLLLEVRGLGMEALVEIHEESDLEKALAAGCRLVGINNRDLQTFRVDLAVTERLVRQIPSQIVVVSCSGIRRREEILRLEQAGVMAFLVGESLVAAEDPEAALRGLVA